MASVKCYDLSEGAIIRWDTSHLSKLDYDKNKVRRIYNQYVYPKLCEMKYIDRVFVRNAFLDIIRNERWLIMDQQGLVDLILAFKLTCISDYDFTEDGYCQICMLESNHPSLDVEKIMFWNIIFHLSNHISKPETWSFISINSPHMKGAMNYLGATVDDKDDVWETKYERDKYQAKKTRSKIREKKKEIPGQMHLGKDFADIFSRNNSIN